MPLADDPAYFIFFQFKRAMNSRADGYYKAIKLGFTLEELPLDQGEKIFGVCKDKYYFSPRSLIVNNEISIDKIYWNEIDNCSSTHGSGDTFSTITLIDTSKIKVKISEFGEGGWNRISQLFHGMIDRWGNNSTLGLPPLSTEDFFNQTSNKFSLEPNRLDHPSISESQRLLLELEQHEAILSLKLNIVEYDGDEPTANGLIIETRLDRDELMDVLEQLKIKEIYEASDNMKKSMISGQPSNHIFFAVWL